VWLSYQIFNSHLMVVGYFYLLLLLFAIAVVVNLVGVSFHTCTSQSMNS
jgi:hypothetical protein